jgi:hypothetical protein
MGGLPAELNASPGRLGALVEEKHLREVIAETRARLGLGPGNGTRCTDGEGGGLSEFCDGRSEPVPNRVVATGRLLLESTAEEVRQVRHVHSHPMLPSFADHDQISGVVSWRTKKQSGDPASRVAVGRTRDRDDCPYAFRTEQTRSIGSFHATIGGGLRGESSVMAVLDP